MSTSHTFLLALWVAATPACLWAQLPTARLLTIFPAGGKAGSACEVTVTGVDLDDARGISFSHSNIIATVQTNGAGRFSVSIGTDVASGIYDARVIGRFGVSNPRRFVVGDLEEVTEKDNDASTNAMAIAVGTTVNGRAAANEVDHFKVYARTGQRVAMACEAGTIDSRMEPSLVLYDDRQRELKQCRRGGRLEFLATKDGDYVLKVHDFLFAGGNEHFYRLTVREAQEETVKHQQERYEAEALKAPCEVQGTFYPAGDVDRYAFDTKKGETWWVEVFSHRLGWPTDPLLLINDQEFNDIDNIGGVEFRTSSRDAIGRFEAKEDGTTCRIQVRDLFNQTVDDPQRAYRLVVRKETPDFDLVAIPQGPPPKKDSREALMWPCVLRRGETTPIKVIALRQDGFKGEISVHATDLPAGVGSSELVIAGDKNSGVLLVTASETATNCAGAIAIVGKSSVGTHVGSAATVIWNVPDYNNEPVRSRLAESFTLAVCDELVPITVAAAEAKTYEAPASGKLAIPIQVTRRGEFTEAFKMKAHGVSALDSLKEIEIKEKATNATVELDLSQQKLSPGSYSFYLQGQTKGKYANPVDKKTKELTLTVYSRPIMVKVSAPQTASTQ